MWAYFKGQVALFSQLHLAPHISRCGGAGEPKACHGEQVCLAAISWRDGEHFHLSERMTDGIKASLDLLNDHDEPFPMGRTL